MGTGLPQGKTLPSQAQGPGSRIRLGVDGTQLPAVESGTKVAVKVLFL